MDPPCFGGLVFGDDEDEEEDDDEEDEDEEDVFSPTNASKRSTRLMDSGLIAD